MNSNKVFVNYFGGKCIKYFSWEYENLKYIYITWCMYTPIAHLLIIFSFLLNALVGHLQHDL